MGSYCSRSSQCAEESKQNLGPPADVKRGMYILLEQVVGADQVHFRAKYCIAAVRHIKFHTKFSSV